MWIPCVAVIAHVRQHPKTAMSDTEAPEMKDAQSAPASEPEKKKEEKAPAVDPHKARYVTLATAARKQILMHRKGRPLTAAETMVYDMACKGDDASLDVLGTMAEQEAKEAEERAAARRKNLKKTTKKEEEEGDEAPMETDPDQPAIEKAPESRAKKPTQQAMEATTASDDVPSKKKPALPLRRPIGGESSAAPGAMDPGTEDQGDAETVLVASEDVAAEAVLAPRERDSRIEANEHASKLLKAKFPGPEGANNAAVYMLRTHQLLVRPWLESLQAYARDTQRRELPRIMFTTQENVNRGSGMRLPRGGTQDTIVFAADVPAGVKPPNKLGTGFVISTLAMGDTLRNMQKSYAARNEGQIARQLALLAHAASDDLSPAFEPDDLHRYERVLERYAEDASGRMESIDDEMAKFYKRGRY